MILYSLKIGDYVFRKKSEGRNIISRVRKRTVSFPNNYDPEWGQTNHY